MFISVHPNIKSSLFLKLEVVVVDIIMLSGNLFQCSAIILWLKKYFLISSRDVSKVHCIKTKIHE